jgi:hypothetical protein
MAKDREPTEVFLDWFNSIDSSIKKDISFFVLVALHGFRYKASDPLNLEQEIISWLSDQSDDPPRVIGKLLTLHAAIDFFMFKKRRSESDWQENKEMLLSFLEDATLEGKASIANNLEQMIESLPERAAKHFDAILSWEKLWKEHLTDRFLDDWMMKKHNPNEEDDN